MEKNSDSNRNGNSNGNNNNSNGNSNGNSNSNSNSNNITISDLKTVLVEDVLKDKDEIKKSISDIILTGKNEREKILLKISEFRKSGKIKKYATYSKLGVSVLNLLLYMIIIIYMFKKDNLSKSIFNIINKTNNLVLYLGIITLIILYIDLIKLLYQFIKLYIYLNENVVIFVLTIVNIILNKFINHLISIDGDMELIGLLRAIIIIFLIIIIYGIYKKIRNNDTKSETDMFISFVADNLDSLEIYNMIKSITKTGKIPEHIYNQYYKNTLEDKDKRNIKNLHQHLNSKAYDIIDDVRYIYLYKNMLIQK
jgi:hypothetical protein